MCVTWVVWVIFREFKLSGGGFYESQGISHWTKCWLIVFPNSVFPTWFQSAHLRSTGSPLSADYICIWVHLAVLRTSLLPATKRPSNPATSFCLSRETCANLHEKKDRIAPHPHRHLCCTQKPKKKWENNIYIEEAALEIKSKARYANVAHRGQPYGIRPTPRRRWWWWWWRSQIPAPRSLLLRPPPGDGTSADCQH